MSRIIRTIIRTTLALLLAAPLAAQSYSAIGLGRNCNLNGFRPFPGNPLNQPITTAALDPTNSAWHSFYDNRYLSMDFNSVDYGIPYTCVDSSNMPLVPVNMVSYKNPDSDLLGYPLDINQSEEDTRPPCPYNANTATDGSDHHALTVDRHTGWAYALTRAWFCDGQWGAANGNVWDMTQDEKRPFGSTSEDAGGLSVFAWLAKYEECTTQTVPQQLNGVTVQTCGHALRVTMALLQCTEYFSDAYGGFILPATHSACNNSGSPSIYGQRLRLQAGYDTSGMSGEALVIANTLKTYGMVVADIGQDFHVIGTQDAHWHDSLVSVLNSIPATALDLTVMGPVYTAYTGPNGHHYFPSAPSPTNSPLTVSPSVIVQGQAAILNRTAASTYTSYEFVENGPPLRPADANVPIAPLNSTCLRLVSRNANDTATSAYSCVTVLVPPLVGAGVAGLR